MTHDLGNTSNLGCNDGDLTGHGLEGYQSKRLEFARQQQDVGNGQEPVHLVLLAHKQHIFGDTVRIREPFGLRTLRAVAYHQEPGFLLLSDLGEDCDDVLNPLHGPKV